MTELRTSTLSFGSQGARRSLWPKSQSVPRHAAMPGGVQVGGATFLSGQCAMDDSGTLVGAGDCLEQARYCFKNIAELLESADLTMSDIVKLTCYLTRAENYPAYAQAKQKWFPQVAPPGTCVVVRELLLPGALIEIDVIALAASA